MRVRVLGPLSVEDGGERLTPRDRVVLATLVVHAGDLVSADRMADALWGAAPPATWPKAVQGCVVRLRKALGPDSIRTSGRGYVLTLPDDEIDAVLFERLVRRGQELLQLGETERAAFTLDQALELWHGPALGELDGWEPGAAAAERLEELRRDAEELRVEASLRRGAWRRVLPDAAALVTEQPLREQRWALLARAQYQAGRQGESLATLHRARTVLVGELGLDPGPELVALERAILHQDAALLPDPDDAVVSPVCPYRGLVPYDLTDSEEYFGRDAEVAACRDALDRQGVVVVAGPSGSGKSSLVRAGVAAALRRDGRPVAVLTPGAHPVTALAEAGALRTSTVLVVDQVEEIVAMCQDLGEREAFLDALVAHADSGSGVVVALRADRLGSLTGHRGFSRLLQQGLHLLGPMSEPDLRAAIEGPAHRAGLLLEPGLVDLLVEELSGEPGALPLLSHALAGTWENREGRTMTVAGYRKAGGVRGAVTQTAETLFQGLPSAQQHALRDLLLRLVSANPDGQAARSPIPRHALAGDAGLDSLIEVLVAARLVTSDGDVVEIAHESLVWAWPRLRSWLDDDLEGQRILRHLTVASESWETMGRPTGELYRGVRLERALAWRDHTTTELTATERAFLDAGRDLAEAESRSAERHLAEQRRVNRRLRGLLAGLAAVLAVALAAGTAAVVQGHRADEQTVLAQVRELAAASGAAAATDAELAVLLALRATELSQEMSGGPAREAIEALHGAVIASRIETVVDGIGGSVAWSPTGDVFVTEGPENTGLVDLRDARSGASVRAFVGHDVDVNDVAFSAGGLLATTGDDGALRVWDPVDGRLVSEVLGTGQVWGPSFAADSDRLAAAWLDEGVVRVVDVSSGEVLTEAAVPGGPRTTSFSPNGGEVAVGRKYLAGAVVLAAATGTTLRTVAGGGPARAVRFSPDGRWLATAGEDGTVRLRDARTGEAVQVLADAGGAVAALAWAPDSHRLAAGGFDGSARVYEIVADLAGPPLAIAGVTTASGVVGLAFSPDGSRLLTGDDRVSAATIWDVGPDGGAEVANLPGRPGTALYPAYLADGRIALTSDFGSVTIRDGTDATSGRRIDPVGIPGPEGTPAGDVSAVAVSPGGDLLATGGGRQARVWDLAGGGRQARVWDLAGGGRQARVWDLAGGDQLYTVTTGTWVSRPAFSPDGALLALASYSGTVGLYERDGTVRARLGVGPGYGLDEPVFSPDGSTVAVVQVPLDRPDPTDFHVLLWDWRSGTTRSLPDVHANRVVYSPDGTRLAVVTLSGPAEIRRAGSAELLHTLEGHSAAVLDVTFSPDGRLVATGGLDGTVRLWDASSGAAVLRLPAVPGAVASVTFSPDGRHVAASDPEEGVVRVWTLDPDELVSIARTRVARGLSDAECQEYLHMPQCP